MIKETNIECGKFFVALIGFLQIILIIFRFQEFLNRSPVPSDMAANLFAIEMNQ